MSFYIKAKLIFLKNLYFVFVLKIFKRKNKKNTREFWKKTLIFYRIHKKHLVALREPL